MRYYLIAGERSGDLHGGNLIRSLRQYDPNFIGRGFGGAEMQQAGMELTVHYDKLAFMGFIAVIANLGKISGFMKQCKADILSFKPDVIVLIDYGGFNMRIAKFAHDLGLKVYFYISPKVWAWNTKRAWKLKANVDRMFCILPFEKEFFKKFDWDVDYVGSPVLDAIKKFKPDPDFLAKNDLPADKKIVALLPGSRKMELQRMLPTMAAVARANTDLLFIVAAVKTLPAELYKPATDAGVRLVYESTYDLLSHSSAALVTSGTATLETALLKVPEALLYKASYLEEKLVRAMIKVRYLGLVNLIADKTIVKEFIQNDMSPGNLKEELSRLVHNEDYRNNMLREYENVYRILDTGSASDNAARLMIGYLRNKS